MAITFENEKILFDDKYGTAKEIDCFLPVHLTIGGKENDLYKKDGSHNEQYYKWQFLYCFVSAGLCSKDFIGVEVSFPKGNKNSASIKLDAAIFDNKDWFEHYSALHTITEREAFSSGFILATRIMVEVMEGLGTVEEI